jgi:hypothetical protein
VIQRDFNYEQSKSAITKEIQTIGTGLKSGLIGTAASSFEGDLASGEMSKERAMELALLRQEAELLKMAFQGIEDSIFSVGEALGSVMTTGIAGLITGTTSAREVFVGFLSDVGQALAGTAKKMIAQYIAIGIAKMFAGLGGGGVGGSSFFGGGGASASSFSFNPGAITNDIPFKPFANGGIVKGPTLGLVGEGKYNEAIVPLPDGRSIPVQMRGQQSSRELLSNNAQQSSSPSVLSMKFETTRFGDTDYVDVKQLEQAMAETRKAASRDGASRGASLALDRLQNSPTARRKIGLR